MARKIDWSKKLNEWLHLLEELSSEITSWALEEKWSIDRQSKLITEEYLGSYEVPVLLIQTPETRIYIDPIGRSIVGAEGRVDITSFPGLNRILLIRSNDKWVLKTDSRVDWPEPWSKDSFLSIVHALAA